MRDYQTKPLCFWAWNGEMELERIRSQLKDFKEKGMGGVFVHARAGLKIPYMGEEWMDAFEATVQECGRLGLDVWIYDEDGWPSGFGGGRVYAADPDYVERYLSWKEVLPGQTLPEHLVAAYRRDGEGYRLILADELIRDFELPELSGTLALGEGQSAYGSERDFLRAAAELRLQSAEGKAAEAASRHTEPRAEERGEPVLAVYATFNPVYVDILNRDAVQYFFQVIHERYRERFADSFGKVIKGVFTDEPHFSPAGLPWGRYVAEAFEAANGYSVYQALPYLFEKRGDYAPYRYDFWKNISGMIQDSYARPYYAWCSANGLAFTGHYACEEGQVDQIAVSGGVMPLYEYQHLPGVDALGNRQAPAPIFKQAEAVAWQLGERRVLCETYACSGYDATFSDVMWIWGYQAAMGVNVPCLSISMYSLAGSRKRDYPVFFSEQLPWWEHFRELSDCFCRISGAMLEGDRRDGILVIHPKTGVWCERGKEAEIEEKSISSDFRRLTEALLDLQREFDYGDEQILAGHGKISGTALEVGKRRYHTVMVPRTCSIEASTAALLRAFAEAGGRVIFLDALPARVGGRPAEKGQFDFEKLLLANRTDLLRKYFVCTQPLQEIELIDRYTRRPALGFVTAVRVNEQGLCLLAVSRSREERRSVRVRAAGRVGLVKESALGIRFPLAAEYDERNDCTYADVEFDAQEVCLIRTCPFEPVRSCGLEEAAGLQVVSVQTEDNLLVVDRVFWSLDGGPESEDSPIFATAKIYRSIDGLGRSARLKMRYRFTVRELPQAPVALVCEDEGVSVALNGKALSREGFVWDRAFGRYPVGAAIRPGLNEAVLEREIGPYRSQYDLDHVFQSVTNVFSYEYDVENVYLLGRFDVEPAGGFSAGENCRWLNGESAIVPYREKRSCGDLTVQGMPFYAGRVRLRAGYECSGEEDCRYVLEYGKPNFPVGELYVNGAFAGLLGLAPCRIELTKLLQTGGNTLEIVLFSTARNLFGPFHHVKGRHNYIGPTIFKGYVEFEDPVVFPELVGKNTWTDDVSVIPFGIGEISIRKERFI